jgi:signal transduction histidine kinase
MDPAPDLSLQKLALFIRQHTHDLRNELNGLELEATLLADIVPGGEAAECVVRIRGQIRRVAADMHRLAAKFIGPRPTRAHYAARDLFLIWQDQLAALDPAPVVQWGEAPGTGQVNVDAAELAEVFRELLANAQRFGTGAPLSAAARVEDRQIVFELREPKDAPLETAGWGSAPFASIMRHGHYGLGLWDAQRTIVANGGEVQTRFAQETMELSTTLLFPIA